MGERLVATGLDLLLLLVESAYAREKRDLLRTASRRANALRYLLRLSKDLRLLSKDSYEFAAGRLDDIGRMLGGWLRSVERRP